MTVHFDFPTGSVVPHSSAVAPAGWVLCDGRTYDGTTEQFKPLWLLIGTTYGGSSQSAFMVPNLGGRTPRGVGASTSGSGINGPVGAWDGATAVTLTGAQTGRISHGHSTSWDGSTGDPGHGHSIGWSDHTHSVGYTSAAARDKNQQTATAYHHSGNPATYTSVAANTAVSVGNTTISGVSTSNAGNTNASSSHTNVQPQLALAFIIKL